MCHNVYMHTMCKRVSKDLQEVLRQSLRDVGARRARHGLGPLVHEGSDVPLDKDLLRRMEFFVDVTKRHQQEDDGLHLLLGNNRIPIELQHGEERTSATAAGTDGASTLAHPSRPDHLPDESFASL